MTCLYLERKWHENLKTQMFWDNACLNRSGQIIIFHQRRFPWIEGSHFPSKKLPFAGPKHVWGRYILTKLIDFQPFQKLSHHSPVVFVKVEVIWTHQWHFRRIVTYDLHLGKQNVFEETGFQKKTNHITAFIGFFDVVVCFFDVEENTQK